MKNFLLLLILIFSLSVQGANLTITLTGDVICIGNTGTIIVNVTGGAPPYLIEYSGGIPLVNGLVDPFSDTLIDNPTATTTYQAIVTDSNGDKDTASADIVVNSLPTITTTDVADCYLNDITLIASGGATYSWEALGVPAGIVVSGGFSNAPVVRTDDPTPTGDVIREFEVTVTDGKGCVNKDTVQVTFVLNCGPTVIAIGDTICQGEVATLMAIATHTTGAVTYEWTPPVALNDHTIANPVAQITTTTTFQVIVTDDLGSDTAIATVLVDSFPNAGTDNFSSMLCNGTGSSIDLNTLLSGATAGGTWEEKTTIPSGQFNNATGMFDGSGLNTGPYDFIYYVSGSGACSNYNDTAEFIVYVDSMPIADFTYTDNGNGNYSFANTSRGSSFNVIDWQFDDGQTSSLTNPSHTFASNGTFTVVLAIGDTSANRLACFDYVAKNITVTGVSIPLTCSAGYAILKDSLNSDITIVNNSTGTNLSYLWDFGDGTTSTLANPTHTYATNNDYELCLTVDDGNGCMDTYCDTINSKGIRFNKSGFTINVVSPTALAVDDIQKERILTSSIYPNPNNGMFTLTIKSSTSEVADIAVVDVTGKVIMEERVNLSSGKQEVQLSLKSHVTQGLYFLNVKTAECNLTKKIVIQ